MLARISSAVLTQMSQGRHQGTRGAEAAVLGKGGEALDSQPLALGDPLPGGRSLSVAGRRHEDGGVARPQQGAAEGSLDVRAFSGPDGPLLHGGVDGPPPVARDGCLLDDPLSGRTAGKTRERRGLHIRARVLPVAAPLEERAQLHGRRPFRYLEPRRLAPADVEGLGGLHRHPSGRISRSPSVPCTGTRSPSRSSRGACSTPTTAGKPYSRAITAPWVIRPPTSVTRPLIATNTGVQLGSVQAVASMS